MSGGVVSGRKGRGLKLGAAVTAQNLVLLREEADAHQRGGAAGAGEAAVVPVAVLEGHKLPLPETCDWLIADLTFLSVVFGEALNAVGIVLFGGELLPCQLLPTACAHKTVPVPRLVTIGHAAGRQHLLAAAAAGGKLVLIAGRAVMPVVIRYEGFAPDWLLAAETDEAFLVPGLPLVFQLLGARLNTLVAGCAGGGELALEAGVAEQLFPMTGEPLIPQRAAAAGAAQALLVEVLAIIGQLPDVVLDSLLALRTGVGAHLVEAGDAVR